MSNTGDPGITASRYDILLIASGQPLKVDYVYPSGFPGRLPDETGHPELKHLFRSEAVSILNGVFTGERGTRKSLTTRMNLKSGPARVRLDAGISESNGIRSLVMHISIIDDQPVVEVKNILQTLSGAALLFHGSKDEGELYQRLTDTVSSIVRDDYVFAAIADDQGILRIISYNEKTAEILPLAKQFLGFDPVGFELPLAAIEEDILALFKSEKLSKIPSFYEITGGAVDKNTSRIITEALGIRSMYGLGFMQDYHYYGALAILSASADSLSGHEIIEMIVRQASHAIHRIRINKALTLAEQRYQQMLSQRISILTQPETLIEELEFADLFDIGEIQQIQDAFSDATGVASLITDAAGKPLTRPSNFCHLCEHVIRRTEKGRANCMYSDSVIGRHHPEGPVIQPCLSGALWDAGASITIGNRHIASWLIGQVLDDDADLEQMVSYADQIGVEREAYLNALSQVKRMPKKQFESISGSLFLIANQLSAKALQNIQQARVLAERQRVESENAEIMRRLETLMGNLPGMAYRCRNDRQWTMEFVSRGSFELTGYHPDELVGNRVVAFNDLILKDSREDIWIKWQEMLSGRQVFTDEYRILTADGRIKWVWEQGCGIYDDEGNVVALEGLIIDNTARRDAEIKLRDSELRFRTLFEDSDDASLIIEDGVFIDCNDATLRLLKTTRENVVGREPFQLSPPRQPDGQTSTRKAVRMINTAKKYGSHRFDWLHRRPDGTDFWVEVVLTIIRIQEKEIIYTTWRDITDRKQADQELRDMNEKLARLNKEYMLLIDEIAEKNKALGIAINKAEESDRLKSAFLANMSHEIRTPMNGILGFAELLLTPGLPQEDMASFVGIINTCSAQLMALINDIIDISKIEAGQITISQGRVSLRKMMAGLFAIASKTHYTGVELVAPNLLDENDIVVMGDEVRLRQIMINLITNAIKFTKRGRVEFGYAAEGDKISFYVKDNGIGISPEHHELIFKRFRQVNATSSKEQGGTGLGLAISKALVEQMGGVIGVESALGEGSTFRVVIPFPEMVSGLPESEMAVEKVEPVYNWKGKTILIAEDEDANFTLLKMYLKGTGCEILRANDGEEAVSVSLDAGPDLVLMDLKMPLMSGFDATRKIKSVKPGLPVIAQTAYALSDDRQKALDAGCDHYISKPINRKTLLTTISWYLSG